MVGQNAEFAYEASVRAGLEHKGSNSPAILLVGDHQKETLGSGIKRSGESSCLKVNCEPHLRPTLALRFCTNTVSPKMFFQPAADQSSTPLCHRRRRGDGDRSRLRFAKLIITDISSGPITVACQEFLWSCSSVIIDLFLSYLVFFLPHYIEPVKTDNCRLQAKTI